MTNAQKLTVRASEIRQRLNEISGLEGDALTDEVRAESTTLGNEFAEVETKLRAAIISDGERTVTAEDGEARELRQLTEKSNVGSMLGAILEKRSVEGPEAELQQHHGLAPNQIPLDLLRLRPEERAVTPSPTNVEVDQETVVQPVFANSAGDYLGIYRPTVAMGDAVFPVLSQRPSVRGPFTGSDVAAETTGAWGSELLVPERIQASFFWKRTDAARFASMDSALRMALNDGLAEKADQEIVNGSDGLLNGTNLPNHNTAAVTTFQNYVSRFAYGRVDGRYAVADMDVRSLVGSATYGHMGATYQSTPQASALDWLKTKSGGVRVSAHVPAVVSKKQNSVIRLGMRRDMVQPMWAAVSIVFDEVTLSSKGEIQITAILLLATKIIRADGFYKQQSQVEA